MPQEIYNEGRVVGFSAWEIFQREATQNGVNPSIIPDEATWLAAMVSNGSSMILKVPLGTQAGIRDFPLPSNSNLIGAGIIVANPFLGECDWDTNGRWATRVSSYSPLIVNNKSVYPSDSEVPSSAYNVAQYNDNISQFTKITDGIVYTLDANWVNSAVAPISPSTSPAKDINPNLRNNGNPTSVVRLCISTDITSDTYIILTGFQNKGIIGAVSGYATGGVGGSNDTANNDWQNGGMLGPEVFPWACKIVFNIPNSVYDLLNSINRVIPKDIAISSKTISDKIHFQNLNSTIKSSPVIDFNSIILTDYYDAHTELSSTNPPVLEETVNRLSSSNTNELVAWYPGMTASKISAATTIDNIFPPALYAAQISSTGDQSLVPLDIAAPGTIKGFKTSTEAYNYLQLMPDNYSIYYNSSTGVHSFAIPGQADSTKWPGTTKIEYLSTAPKVKITSGANSVTGIALTNSQGADYNTSGSSGTTTSTTANYGKITWDNLLNALVNNKTYDCMGSRLRDFATELKNSNKIGTDTTNNPINDINSVKLSLRPSGGAADTGANLTAVVDGSIRYITLGTGSSAPSPNASLHVGTNYIKFGTGNNVIKLFISKTQPTSGMQAGDIGIGW